MKPWPGTYTIWNTPKRQQRLILDWVSTVPNPAGPQRAEPGQVLRCESDQLWVATGEGVLAVERIQPAGKRVLEVSEFLRGYRLAAGTRLE